MNFSELDARLIEILSSVDIDKYYTYIKVNASMLEIIKSLDAVAYRQVSEYITQYHFLAFIDNRTRLIDVLVDNDAPDNQVRVRYGGEEFIIEDVAECPKIKPLSEKTKAISSFLNRTIDSFGADLISYKIYCGDSDYVYDLPRFTEMSTFGRVGDTIGTYCGLFVETDCNLADNIIELRGNGEVYTLMVSPLNNGEAV